MTDSQKLNALIVGLLIAVCLSGMALRVAYTRGRVPLVSYAQALQGDRNWQQLLANQCSAKLQQSAGAADEVRVDAARLLGNLIYAIDGKTDDPSKPSLADAKWEAQERIKEWQQR